MALPGWREYQTPPATSRSEAAIPRKSPVFEPEGDDSANCEDSPRSWPPKMATSGRRVDSCDSGLAISSSGSATTASTSPNEFDPAAEFCAAAGVSDSRANGASHAGILISSTSSEDVLGFGGGGTLFTGWVIAGSAEKFVRSKTFCANSGATGISGTAAGVDEVSFGASANNSELSCS